MTVLSSRGAALGVGRGGGFCPTRGVPAGVVLGCVLVVSCDGVLTALPVVLSSSGSTSSLAVFESVLSSANSGVGDGDGEGGGMSGVGDGNGFCL